MIRGALVKHEQALGYAGSCATAVYLAAINSREIIPPKDYELELSVGQVRKPFRFLFYLHFAAC